MRSSAVIFCVGALAAALSSAQTSPTVAGLAGAGAGAALGAGAGQNATTPSSVGGAGGAGGASAPIEIQVMAYHGLRKIAADVASTSVKRLCTDRGITCAKQSTHLLIEDTASATQVALYQAVQGYHDHLKTLHDDLGNTLALEVTPSSLSFQPGGRNPQLVTLTNITVSTSLSIADIGLTGPDTNSFTFAPHQCTISAGSSCSISVTFTGTAVGKAQTASLSILNPGKSPQVVQLTGTGQAPPAAVTPEKRQQFKDFMHNNFGIDVAPNALEAIGAAQTPAAATPTPSGAATTPVDLTYLSTIMTALGGVKSGITYTPSSFQPTTQAFELMVEKELRDKQISPYSSTSALDLTSATGDLTEIFGQMLALGADVSNWTTQCKPPSGNAMPGTAQTGATAAFNPECNKPGVVVNLATAQQMITGYTSLLQTANDGAGNPVIVDVLRGRVLSEKMKQGIPSLQVTVASAGGSTRANVIFLLNLFYTPKPSYNSGVIATFELRDEKNDLLDGGARTVLFDYKATRNLKPQDFKIEEIEPAACGSFCRDR